MKNKLGIAIFFSFFIFTAVVLLPLFFRDISVSAADPYEVSLDGSSRYGSQCYGGKSDYYVDVPSSYSGSKILLKAAGTSNPSSCADLGIDLCDWEESCNVSVTPGQRVSFQVSWYCGYCGDYESESWTIEADSVSGPVCGNGSCESGESCSSCSSDCGSCKKSNGSSCSYGSECSGGYCVHYKCRSSSVYCGDGYCDSGESCSSCSSDCGSCAEEITECSIGTCDLVKDCEKGGIKLKEQPLKKCVKEGEHGRVDRENNSSCAYICCSGAIKDFGEAMYIPDCCTNYDCSFGEKCINNYCKKEEVSKKAAGEFCNTNEECKSGNCQNYRCCVAGKTCCLSTNNCPSKYYCDENKSYCVLAKPDGQFCGKDELCQSGNCESGICCEWGQECCQKHGDCKSSEYCDDSVDYCKYRFSIGEKCGDYGSDMCDSGYCDHNTRTCAEKPEGIDEESTESAPEEKAVCGNKNCEYWLDEDCENCPTDCGFTFANTCCEPGKSFMQPSNYHSRVYKISEALGGVIPEGTFVVPKGLVKASFFSDYTPQICKDREIVKGKCVNNWDCPEGVCGKDFQCVKTTSEEFKKVEDEELTRKIYEKQTGYQKKFSETYDQIKDDISSCAGWKGLKICLEVQGKSARKDRLSGQKAEPVLVILNIENISDYSIAVIPEISFSDGVRFEAKDYNMGLSWSGGLRSILGSFMTTMTKMIMGGKYLVMPPRSKAVVYSKIVPKETGMLEAYGKVYSTSDEEFADNEPGLIDIILKPEQYETNFEKTEVSKQINIQEKPCGWLFCI